MEKFLVMVSGIGPVEYGHYHEAVGCQKDYWAAGHTADIYIHNGSVPALAKRTEDFDGFDVNSTNEAPIPAPSTHDPVNHPKHYTAHVSGVECIQITRHMGFNLGNVMKYIWRADLKNGTEDLEKAAWYLLDEIQKRKGGSKK